MTLDIHYHIIINNDHINKSNYGYSDSGHIDNNADDGMVMMATITMTKSVVVVAAVVMNTSKAMDNDILSKDECRMGCVHHYIAVTS